MNQTSLKASKPASPSRRKASRRASADTAKPAERLLTASMFAVTLLVIGLFLVQQLMPTH
ncbi:hypothetical protein SAMN04488540_1357 [Ferrimonas sediminum]|uniref:Uncharacterized protein n=1 Tax=Ferrimonas sediminum TaxID=718193 RepID=A0A1G9BTK7_9GAMM|nr:hypothetical protein SAMN04488540_1357 [Ferrimonas sediminum]